MKHTHLFLLLPLIISSCIESKTPNIPIEGTWQLLSGTIIEKGDTVKTLYAKDLKMIKIINATHFSFLNHDLHKGNDSTAKFAAGGGKYTLKGNDYTESLEYCSDRNWEGHTFPFKVDIKNDTLIQSGIEKLNDLGIERVTLKGILE